MALRYSVKRAHASHEGLNRAELQRVGLSADTPAGNWGVDTESKSSDASAEIDDESAAHIDTLDPAEHCSIRMDFVTTPIAKSPA